MDLQISDKVALVTGASAGLGYASALALAQDGARVIICSRDLERVEAAAGRIASDTGAHVHPLVCDLTDAESIRSMTGSIDDQFGQLDILVSNAGGPPAGLFADLTPQMWEDALDITFRSTLTLCQTVLPIMVRQSSGSIVVITSLAARQPIAWLVTSNTLRAGINGLIKSISDEYGSRGIRANSVAPGYTRTERLIELAEGMADRDNMTIDEVFEGWEKISPLGRLGEPEEIGAAVAFLSSRRAAFITGQHLAVDGGVIRGTTG